MIMIRVLALVCCCLFVCVCVCFSVPSTAPSDLIVSALTSLSVSLQWNNTTCEETNGPLVSYSIRFGPVVGLVMDINTDSTDFFFHCARTCTQYCL